MRFALAGNQNSGKTTLFNQLTGSNQHVGNFPGVTVERKEGKIKGHAYAEVVDLPGIYSLSPYTKEEIVTRDYLIDAKPDGIINIIDATNIERNLYLSLQLIELGMPTVLALNMMDEMRANGNTVDIEGLSTCLGVPVVPIVASKNEGIHELVDTAIETAENHTLPTVEDFCSGPVHRCIHGVAHLIEDHADRVGVPRRFAATKLVEGDKPMAELLRLSQNEQEAIDHMVLEMERELGTDREAALADMRYQFIEEVVAQTVVKSGKSRERSRSVAADHLLTHKYLAFPIFLGIMMLVFWLTFGVIGQPLSDLLGEGVDFLNGAVSGGLTALEVNPVVRSLVVDGIITGVGTVVSFIPIIVTLFFFLSLLEDSGYMARVAFVMDKPLRRLGLSGRSIVPMLLGFGCTVPATMATRTLSSERDRRMTILLTPFMSCSAKLPIYAAFTAAFFPKSAPFIMMLLYLIGIFVGILIALFLKHLPFFRGQPIPFVMELPNYRIPSLRSVGMLLWDKARDFLQRAFTVIFVATIIIWFLQSFDPRLNPTSSEDASILATLARFIAPIFLPLGFGFWQAAVALIAGFMAKEAVVSTLAVLAGTTVDALPLALGEMFSPLAAFSFLLFTLLYTPCVAAIATVKRELGSGVQAGLVAFAQCALAWLVACLVYQVGSLIVS
ncbi:ferrous iron transport protein B [Ruminococcaceae bacterium OttesenSCG-928-I18]|nr:ferrous iron transport protein B [Ruminococcaceae bacterium OttesenSCG-928-I18]